MRWYGGFVRAIEPYLPRSGRHLDAGCGHGALVHLLGERGFDSYGFDVSAWMIEQARAHAPELATHFAKGDLEHEIPFDGPFDCITCVEVLEHLEDPRGACARLVERLTPDGCLVLTTPNLAPSIPWFDVVAADPTHINVHEPEWWRDVLQGVGLDVERVTTYLALPLLWRVHPRLSRLITTGRGAGPGTLIVARRSPWLPSGDSGIGDQR
jgi:SAM-dependent methyltransferase